MSSAPVKPATTVIVLRQRDGLEVFLVKRHTRSRFMPSAWVFPGGRVDAQDIALSAPYVTGGEHVGERLCLTPELARGFLVAGVRETFEESGIWLGTGALPDALRQPLNDGEVGLEAVLKQHNATIPLDRLLPWSWWVTPDNEPRRYDTRFVVALSADEGRHDNTETVDSGWFTPADALLAVERGEVRMAPPTWWTVREIAALGSIEAVVASSATRQIACIEPVLTMSEDSVCLYLPGHPEHGQPAIEGLPTAIGLDSGRWWTRD